LLEDSFHEGPVDVFAVGIRDVDGFFTATHEGMASS
jgi:hypothetical protein